MLRALIFDFDGVIVDSEPVIMELTRQMATREGWSLSKEEYYRDYLALDDRRIVERLFYTHGRPIDVTRRDALLEWKAAAYRQAIRDGLRPLPGAAEFVKRCRVAGYPLAIASGSLREEVEWLLKKLRLREHFSVLATAEDAEYSKPHPGIYLTALAQLGRLSEFGRHPLHAAECVAVEDAPAGIDAAHAAGIKCVALAHSRPAVELGQADWVFSDFDKLNLAALAASC